MTTTCKTLAVKRALLQMIQLLANKAKKTASRGKKTVGVELANTPSPRVRQMSMAAFQSIARPSGFQRSSAATETEIREKL